MVQTPCAICGSYKDYKIIYQANFSENDFNKKVFSARRLPDTLHYQIVKCGNDGLIRSNPIIEFSRITKLYKDSRFTYEEETKNLEKTYIEALQFVLNKINENDNILEIGCGNGFLLRRLFEMGYKNCFGIEPSIEAVQTADRKIKKRIVNDILKPKIFKGKKFKFIFFFQTLDHIPNPAEFLNLCYKLLYPGGYILAFNHNVESLFAKIFGKRSPIIDIEHIYLYSPETMRKLFEKHKFNPIKIYFPANIISLKHLLWLLPLPFTIKNKLISYNIPNINLRVKLGNLCIIAIKNDKTHY